MKSNNSNTNNKVDGMEDNVKILTKWSCDFCDRKVFDTFEEAEEHEKSCEFNPSSTNFGNRDKTDNPNDLPHTIVIPTPTNPNKNSLFSVTVWTCDVCRVAEFLSYDEALEHEKSCKGLPPDKQKPDVAKSNGVEIYKSEKKTETSETHQSQNYPNEMYKKTGLLEKKRKRSEKEEKKLCTAVQTHSNLPRKEEKLVYLSPLIGCVDDSQHYYSISTFDLIVSQSIDLYEFETNDHVGARAIGCRCHYCSFAWEQQFNGVEFESMWRQEIAEHLMGCKHLPPLAKNKLNNLQPYAGKTSLNIFLRSFFKDNGIQEITSLTSSDASESKSYLSFLPYSMWKERSYNYNNIVFSSRRKRWMEQKNDNSTPHKKIDSKNSTTETTKLIDPITLPLICPTAVPECNGLSNFMKLGLDQLMLSVGKDSRISIGCNHCKVISPIYDTEYWFKRIYSMLYSHLLRRCGGIPNSLRLTLKDLQSQKSKSLGLRIYCDHFADYYKFRKMVSSSGFPAGVTVDTELLEKIAKTKIRKKSDRDQKSSQPGDSNACKKECISPQQLKSPEQTEQEVVPTSRYCSMKLSANSAPTFLPPQGGSPFISSLTHSETNELDDYSYLLLDQLELCEIMKSKHVFQSSNTENATSPVTLPIAVRCQNCKAQPKFAHSIQLPTKKDLSRIVISFHEHIKNCEFTSSSVRCTLANNKDVAKSLQQISSYCDFISSFYGLEDGDSGDGWVFEKSVRWGNTKSFIHRIQKNNQSNDRKHYEAIQTRVALDNLGMKPKISSDQIVSSSLNDSKEWSKKMVLSDYNFILLCQIDMVPVLRKIAATTNTRTSLRQRTKNDEIEDISQTPTESVSPTFAKSPYTIGLRCKHCFSTRGFSSIQQCLTNHTYNFFNHFKNCPNIPRKVAAKIDEVKAYQSLQRSADGVASLTEYVRKIILDVYKMEDLEWNGVTGGVTLGNNAVNVIRKYSKTKQSYSDESDQQQENNFVLPFIICDQVEPLTCSYIDFAS